MENQKQERTAYEVAVEVITKETKGTKIIAQEAKTGTSFFQGKKRLAKVVQSKRGLTVEINVALPKEMEEIVGMEKISAAVAYKKHLGTMKYRYKASDAKDLQKIIKAAVTGFKKEMDSETKEEQAQ